MSKSRVYGTRIKVEKIFEIKNPLEPKVFNNKVKILDIGISLDAPNLKVGSVLLLSSNVGADMNDVDYIVEHHILEILE